MGNGVLVAGRLLEHIAQQFVDTLAYGQVDRPTAERGGWYYNVALGTAAPYSVASEGVACGAYPGPWYGAMRESGVFVNERVRTRLAGFLIHNQDPGTRLARWNTETCTNAGLAGETGDAILAAGGPLGWNRYSGTDTTPTATDFTGATTTRCSRPCLPIRLS
jgi:hypothetical protein